MRVNLGLFSLVIVSMLALSFMPDDPVKGFDYGHVENNKYLNSYFEVEVDLPDGWVVQTREETEHLTKLGSELFAGEDANMKAVIKASEINTASLLAVFQYEVGAPVDYNPNFMMVAENIQHAPGIKTGSDYLFQSRRLLMQSQIDYEPIDEKFKKHDFGGQDFYQMSTTLNYMGLAIKQEYFSTVKNGFCLSTIISYVTKEQQKELFKLVKAMRFKKPSN